MTNSFRFFSLNEQLSLTRQKVKRNLDYRSTVKLGYNELGFNNSVVNEHSVITNLFSSQIGYFSTHINPVITNKNGRSRAVRCNRV
jgi:hypothetical protein